MPLLHFWSSKYAMFKVNNENTRLTSTENFLFEVDNKSITITHFSSKPWFSDVVRGYTNETLS